MDCDLSLAHFDPLHATVASAHPARLRIPREIVVEHAGFATPEAAATCFGRRYHDKRRAEFVTAIVQVGDGWGYLVPGKGPRNARTVRVKPLFEAYRAAGYRLVALAHTHPYGQPHFSEHDMRAMLTTRGASFFVTNWRNETYRVDQAIVDAHLGGKGWRNKPSVVRRLTKAGGFAACAWIEARQSSSARGPLTGET